MGAGVAGLAAATALAEAGGRVSVHEGAGHAGGRCRTFHDSHLERDIDNGNHLLLSGNKDALVFLGRIGAAGRLSGPDWAEFPFMDLYTGERWTVRPTAGRFPWWIFMPSRRVAGSRARDYLRAVRLLRIDAGTTVASCFKDSGVLYRRFWEPMAVAALNTDAEDAAASLLWPVLRESFALGEAACRPRLATRGLSDCLVDPAVAWLTRSGHEIRFHRRLKALDLDNGAVAGLRFSDGDAVAVEPSDSVILALPPAQVAEIVPNIAVPEGSRAIVNAHFRLSAPPATTPALLGLVGGVAQWVFVRGDVASVTVSAADALARDASAEAIAAQLWPEVARALEVSENPSPVFRIIKEKKATFAQTPEQVRRRPATATAWRNLFLAGDWTDTGLPATIEGAVRSGHSAARAARQTTSSP